MEENLRLSRSDMFHKLKDTSIFDLIIIGGGIHGATIAKLAAQAQLKVLLLEKADYAQGTSSRSSKMAHGGLRYLEMLDFKQVFEGVRCREDLFGSYPEFVKPHPFLIPIEESEYFLRIKLGLGLWLYDYFLKNREHNHLWLSEKKIKNLVPALYQKPLMGCYQYFDGIMNDSALVIDNILQSRLAGALCLNYAEVIQIDSVNNHVEVNWKNLLTGESFQHRCRRVVNCSGPWANSFDSSELVLSRGSHILFDVPWNSPALFMPMPGKARYYFIWPHVGGTMVGTTERKINEPVLDPFPSEDEIQEIYLRLDHDLPSANLNSSTAYYAFSGIRALPLRQRFSNSAVLSRKHIWSFKKSTLSLLGGKFTTANWTALEGLKILAKDLQLDLPSRFPRLKLPENLVNESIKSAFEVQQAVCLEDYLRRRTVLEYLPGCALDRLGHMKVELAQYINAEKLELELAEYRSRIGKIKNLLQ